MDRLAAMSGDPEIAALSHPQPRVVVEEDSRVILGDFQYLYPALSLEDWNFTDSDIKEIIQSRLEEASPVDPLELAGSGEVLDAGIPLDRVVALGVGSASARSGELKVLELTAVLVYVPIQTLTFRWGSESITVVLEELTGRAISGRLPFRREWAFMAGLALVAVMGLLMGQFTRTLAAAAFAGGGAGQALGPLTTFLLILAGILAAVAAAGLSVAWNLFRAPLVVTLRAAGLRLETAGPVPPSPFAPVARFAGRVLFEAFLGGPGGRTFQ
jgi:hypothetical protein